MDAVIASLPPEYWDGFLRTLYLSIISGIIALLVGTLLAAMRVSPPWQHFAVSACSMLKWRVTPPLTIIFFFAAIVLPRLGVKFEQFEVAAIIALSSYTAAFIAEAVRSGVNSVPVGQAEAARSVGMTFTQVLGFIVLPPKPCAPSYLR